MHILILTHTTKHNTLNCRITFQKNSGYFIFYLAFQIFASGLEVNLLTLIITYFSSQLNY